jgi:alpha-tubulin suppressor-like RCC1 family protein
MLCRFSRLPRSLALASLAVAGSCERPTSAEKPAIPAALLIVAGQDQSAVVGTELSQPLRVRVLDAEGRPVRQQIVNFRVVEGGGSVFAGAALTSDDGYAQDRWTLGTSTADAQRVEARAVDPNTGTPLVFGTFQATALADVAASIAKSRGDGQQASAGTVLSEPLEVVVRDKYGNPVPNATVLWEPSSGSGSVNPTSSSTNDSGLAATSWTLGTSAGSQTVVATAGSLRDSPLTFAATVNAGTPTRILVSGGNNQTQIVGHPVAVPPTVIVLDGHDNPVSGATVTFAVAAGGGTVSGSSQVTNSSGVASVGNWTLGLVPGTNVLRANVQGLTLSPAEFSAVGTNFQLRSISSGNSSTCGVTSDDVAYCWGLNENGQLGTGSTSDRGQPSLVAGGIGFRDVAVGASHACGLATSAKLYCWGQGDQRLGDGDSQSFADRPSPVAVASGLEFRTLASGWSGGCGLTVAGAAHCWGRDLRGALGNGTLNDSWVPVAVSGGLTFQQLVSGDSFNCGLTASGQAYCWGLHAQGNGSDMGTTTPTAVTGGLSFVSITAGRYFACGVTGSGAAYCWGKNFDGALGDGTTTDRDVPTPVLGGLVFAQLAGGSEHTCGLTTTGSAYCWGSNTSGELGDGTKTDRLSPVQVSGNLIFERIISGGATTCGLTKDARGAYCWGRNPWGQVGDGTTTDRVVPTAVIFP